MIIEIQVLPSPPGNAANYYAHVDAAIAVIEASGLKYEVGALGTTVEGEPDALWPLLRAAHEACLAAGALGLVTVAKIEEAGPAREQPTIDSLTGKFRE